MIPSICGEWCQLLTAPLSERPGTKKPLFNRAELIILLCRHSSHLDTDGNA